MHRRPPRSQPRAPRPALGCVALLVSGCTAPDGGLGWTHAPLDGNVLAQRFEGRGEAAVTCVRAGDPAEVFRGAGTGEIVLFGLLSEETYHCVLEVGAETGSAHFTTDPLPAFLPTWTIEGATDPGAYTLFNSGNNDRANRQSSLLLVDPLGQLRWYYEVPYNAPDLDASYLGDGQMLYGGGFDAPPTVLSLAGEVLLQAGPPSAGLSWHHHVEQLDTGEFVALGTTRNTDGTTTWAGATVEIFDAAMNGPVYVWNTQEGVDAGWLPAGGGDPYHTNAVIVEGQDLYVNFRNLSQLSRVDRTTGAAAWTLGTGGDFALVRADGTPDDPANWMYGQHAPELEDNRLLFYDNGDARLEDPQSRVVEIGIDEVARTAEVLWSFTEPGWYEPIWGDVDRLADGHVLVTKGHAASQTPSAADTTEIFELDPSSGEVVWRLVMDEVTTIGYRAERVDGCAVFANERDCAAAP